MASWFQALTWAGLEEWLLERSPLVEHMVEAIAWLTPARPPPFGTLHLQRVYEEGGLDPAATIRKFRIVQIEGSRHQGKRRGHRRSSVEGALLSTRHR